MRTDPVLQEKLVAALGELASEGDELLAREGCTGKRMDGCGCPVAVFLRKRLGSPLPVQVGLATAIVYSPSAGYGAEPEAFAYLPAPVADIVRRVDQGELPDLVA